VGGESLYGGEILFAWAWAVSVDGVAVALTKSCSISRICLVRDSKMTARATLYFYRAVLITRFGGEDEEKAAAGGDGAGVGEIFVSETLAEACVGGLYSVAADFTLSLF